MKSVCVLLSTYNGVDNLRAQLESLAAQTGVELSVQIRDDGSNDSTVEMLREFSEADKRFNYYVGGNVGATESFLQLVRNSPEADFYAFSDQDDVWDSDKLAVAVKMLENEDMDKPALYYSNLRIVDNDLRFHRLSHAVPHIHGRRCSALVEDMVSGCTAVFNRTARDAAARPLLEQCSIHDGWIYMICSFLGSVVYDFDTHISYRQHDRNSVGAYLDKRHLSMYLSRARGMAVLGGSSEPRYKDAKNLYALFGEDLSPEDMIKVREIIEYKDSVKNKLRLLFDREICASTLPRDFMYRLLIILGKI